MKTPDPAGDVAVFRWHIHVLLARNNLKDEHPKCVDVSLARGPMAHRVIRRYVTPGANHAGGRAPVCSHRAGDAEVADTGVEVGVEHDVACFDVTVQHHWLVLVMDVVQARGYVPHDAVAGVPLPDRCLFLLMLLLAIAASPKEMLIQATILHVLVDKQGLSFVVRPP